MRTEVVAGPTDPTVSIFDQTGITELLEPLEGDHFAAASCVVCACDFGWITLAGSHGGPLPAGHYLGDCGPTTSSTSARRWLRGGHAGRSPRV